MTSSARATVWITGFMLVFFVTLTFSTVYAEKQRMEYQTACVESGGSIDDGDCINR